MLIFIHGFCNSPVALLWMMKEARIEFFPLYFSRSRMRRARLGKPTRLGRKVQTAECHWTETLVKVLWTFIFHPLVDSEVCRGLKSLWLNHHQVCGMRIHYMSCRTSNVKKNHRKGSETWSAMNVLFSIKVVIIPNKNAVGSQKGLTLRSCKTLVSLHHSNSNLE